MPKRVSLKGKGAEIFFGGETTTAEDPATAEQLPAPTASELSPEQPATETTSESMQASKNASMQEEAPPDIGLVPTGPHSEGLSEGALDAVWQSVSDQATITNAFRYTEAELSGINDALYELTKTYSSKLSKQDIARLGLNLVLWDYRTRKRKSLLAQLAIRRQRTKRK